MYKYTIGERIGDWLVDHAHGGLMLGVIGDDGGGLAGQGDSENSGGSGIASMGNIELYLLVGGYLGIGKKTGPIAGLGLGIGGDGCVGGIVGWHICGFGVGGFIPLLPVWGKHASWSTAGAYVASEGITDSVTEPLAMNLASASAPATTNLTEIVSEYMPQLTEYMGPITENLSPIAPSLATSIMIALPIAATITYKGGKMKQWLYKKFEKHIKYF